MSKRVSYNVAASAGGVTYSPVFVVDAWANPCNIGIGVTVSAAGVYDVQHTFADPFTVNLNNPTAAAWLNNDVLTSASTSDDTNYAFPPTAIRLAARAGSGVFTFTVVQAGPEV